MSNNFLKITVLACLLAAAAVAQAQDTNVVSKLTEHGGLKKRKARSLVNKVSKKMRKAADSFAGMNDPIRRAMRIAVFGSASASPQQDMINDAKARLYLYSGLDGRALALLFRPGPTSLANCVSGFGLKQGECESLLAAASLRSVAEIRQRQRARQQRHTAPVPVAQPLPAEKSVTQPLPAEKSVTQPVPAKKSATRPAPARPASAPNLSTAAAYKARRERYLAKFKKKKKNKPEAPPAAPAPAAAEPAAAITPATAPSSAPAPASTSETAKPGAPAKPKKAAPESDSLIDDLLSHPLGND